MTKSNEKQKKNTPAFIAYHVPERENAKWERIGAAWHHDDGKGFTLSLSLMPMTAGRIVLRKYEPKEAA